jgi:hypothetical protein
VDLYCGGLILWEKGRRGSIDCKSIRVEQGAISTVDRVSMWHSSYTFREETLWERRCVETIGKLEVEVPKEIATIGFRRECEP